MRTLRKAVAAVALSAAAVGLAPAVASAHDPGGPPPAPIDIAAVTDALSNVLNKAAAGTLTQADIDAFSNSVEAVIYAIQHGVLGL